MDHRGNCLREREDKRMNINSWLTALGGSGLDKMQQIGFFAFVTVAVISLFSSLFVAFLYLRFYDTRASGSQVYRAFPLLGLSITAVFICVQFSLPLSLGLLGALSIVRFRTPIKEPEEVGFIMLVIATSLCCATFNLFFLGILLGVAVIGLLIQYRGARWINRRRNDGMLIVNMPASSKERSTEHLLAFLQKKLPAGRIESLSENKEDSVVSYSFRHLDQKTLFELSEMQTEIPQATYNVFFNRPGEI